MDAQCYVAIDKSRLSVKQEVCFARMYLCGHTSYCMYRLDSVRMLDTSSQESLAEYIVRPPVSLKKIPYEPFKGRLLFHTTYSHYFKQNLDMFEALDFLAERAPGGWRASRPTAPISQERGYEPLSESEEEVETNARKRACDAPSCEGIRGRPFALPEVRRGDESHRNHRGSRRDQTHPSAPRKERAFTARIRS